MKTLYIIRHAKSSWKDMTLDDFDRPLNKRGKKDVVTMGKRLKERGICPDIILSSPAKRAKGTAKALSKEIGYDRKIKYIDTIYEASPETLENILNSVDKKYETVFLIGHNPGLNILAQKYAGFDENLPTCGTVALKFDMKELLWVDYPKKLSQVKN